MFSGVLGALGVGESGTYNTINSSPHPSLPQPPQHIRILVRNLSELSCAYGYGLDGMETLLRLRARARRNGSGQGRAKGPPKLSNAYVHQVGMFFHENTVIFERLLDFAPV